MNINSFGINLFIFQVGRCSLRQSDKKQLVSGLEHFLDLEVRMGDDVLRSDRKLLRRLAGFARAERVELRLTQHNFGYRVELTVERGVRQDVTSVKCVFQNKSFIIIWHTLTNMGLALKNLLIKVE